MNFFEKLQYIFSIDSKIESLEHQINELSSQIKEQNTLISSLTKQIDEFNHRKVWWLK
jgi:peptidoglycan hydrolase CwlO-like protein